MADAQSIPEFKTCPYCEQRLHHTMFYRGKSYRDGLDYSCKKCKIARSMARNRRPDVVSQRSEHHRKKWREDAKYREARTEAQREYKRQPGVSERYAVLQLSYIRKNPEKYAARSRESHERRKRSPRYICSNRIRSGIRSSLRGKRKSAPVFELLGYSASDLRKHIEQQFLPGMTWDNSEKWHIDHIVPLSEFCISGWSDPELKRAWALSNLRPLWATDNMHKHAKRTHLI